MGIVNQLKMRPDVQTLTNLPEKFCDRVEKESDELDILALVFDRYDRLKPSLKQQTWDSRAKQQPVQYNLTTKR
jgi:hypothetical protein